MRTIIKTSLFLKKTIISLGWTTSVIYAKLLRQNRLYFRFITLAVDNRNVRRPSMVHC